MKMEIEAEGKRFAVSFDSENKNETELAFKGLHEFLEKFDLETETENES